MQSSTSRIVQNCVLVWLDPDINKLDNAYQNPINEFQHIVTPHTFVDVEECVDFITEIKHEKVFLITTIVLGKQLVSNIHNLPQIDSIYIFCNTESTQQQWVNDWYKVKGVFTDLQLICATLKQHMIQCDRNLIPISFLSKDQESLSQNLDQLDSSFMYTVLLKEILIKLDYKPEAIQELTRFCRQNYDGNGSYLQIIDKFEQEYTKHSPIWWYTYTNLACQMLNHALRTLNVNTIVTMGVFIQHLHKNIEEIHSKQITTIKEAFIVYRGQSMSKTDFNKMKNSKGGLISFNNFLSTSKNRTISLFFAEASLQNDESIRILFQMTIDPSISTTPFVSINEEGYYNNAEEEILFSMHTVFRIDAIKLLECQIWQVDLILTADNDPQLNILTEYMRNETSDQPDWQRLTRLMIRTANFDKAEELCNFLLQHTSEENYEDCTRIHTQIGYIKQHKGQYDQAIENYEKTLTIQNQYLSPKLFTFTATYSNLGSVYEDMGEYEKAIAFYQKSIDLAETCSELHRPDLAFFYNNIASTGC
ncbi:unnamed protein product [Rotaria sp. Silwood2]|nr:unnamed protein product [Rotaria sp. Silwood2]CAF3101179.1 unnamed protein product [Rotaria sp. Silwood2]CAF3416808.1 unnamed protein product [Rotaria sp. Silwood2]CAF4403235.1 unnamed protein product [Rotaria sp. Silwood2]CAF4483428.1 unnamed protein product [Rotaria sp. Silwood2]